ncbi:hypothetical protein Pst134EA_024652 [Puccinia striiformis f. sp. tritici]|uniref:hypothetical protein n=1 Tax=Puccinia striiformis f. sp. tritici TaxID=168172 RepID=UPI002008446C|nr:hypothetical protein Pst134EA_024652 [Puccinia striiformis f. sp. tritici]KAH9453787.1 hypothetical protein Pst134EA_024652 [Puccinia striiformis f. sp. tritici]KAI9620907.1 hypothetical protein H4Q26_013582 [Puccinia striiformis f. sp. tritici PST-130]
MATRNTSSRTTNLTRHIPTKTNTPTTREEAIKVQGGGKPILLREWYRWESLSTTSRESWPVRPGYVVEKGANKTSLVPNIRIRVIPNKLSPGSTPHSQY